MRLRRAATWERFEVLRGHGCPWSAATTAAAARRNQFEALKWLHSNGCPWDERVVFEASANEDAVMLKWCLDHDAPVQDDICTELVSHCAFGLDEVLNKLYAIHALNARGHACDNNTVTALLTRLVYGGTHDNKQQAELRRRIHLIMLQQCICNGVVPTREHLHLALESGEYLAAEQILKIDPSL